MFRSRTHASLETVGKEDEYPKFEARLYGCFGVAGASMGVVGSFIAAKSMDALGVVQVIVTASFATLILFLVEPPRQLSRETTAPRLGIWQAFKEMGQVLSYALRHHARLRWLILFSAVMGPTTLITMFLIQAYALELGLSIKEVGMLGSAQYLLAGLAAFFVAERFAAIGRGRALAILACTMVAVLAGMAVSESVSLLLLLMVGFCFVLGAWTTTTNSAIQEEIDRSGVRATVLSIQGVADDAVYIVLGPTVGLVADAASVQTAFMVMALVCGTFCVIAL